MLTYRGLLSSAAICCALLIAAAVIPSPPSKAHPGSTSAEPPYCACCSEEGERYERTDRVDAAQLVQLDRVRFSSNATRFTTLADESELSDSYSLSQSRKGKRWEFRFKDDKGKTGILSFTIPAAYTAFGVDLREQSEDAGLGPLLYKELRLKGAAQVSGILKQGINGPARFELILQGRGRACTEAEDFKNWRLQVKGARDSHIFYGSLGKPE
ncbi:MAG TPA: hypothetical protein VEX60_06820 [Pyrinomonadaceae bacterium]|nr:hypothetical protein [Pyrinomonadaceae bacterium]